MHGAAVCEETSEVKAEGPLHTLTASFEPLLHLAPPPHRGKRNEPAHTAHTARVGFTAWATPILPPRTKRTLTACSGRPCNVRQPHNGQNALHHPWLRVIGRCAAPWRPLGRRAAAAPMLVERVTDHPRSDRHLPRHARKTAQRRGWTPWSIPQPCQPCPLVSLLDYRKFWSIGGMALWRACAIERVNGHGGVTQKHRSRIPVW